MKIFNIIQEDPFYLLPIGLLSVGIFIFLCMMYGLFYEDFYYPRIKKPICKYIEERNERLMIKMSSNLKLRGNSKTQYLKLL